MMMNKKLNDDHMPAWAVALSEDVQMLSILQEKKSRKRARKELLDFANPKVPRDIFPYLGHARAHDKERQEREW